MTKKKSNVVGEYRPLELVSRDIRSRQAAQDNLAAAKAAAKVKAEQLFGQLKVRGVLRFTAKGREFDLVVRELKPLVARAGGYQWELTDNQFLVGRKAA